MVHSLKKNPSNVYSSSVKGLKTQEIKELNNQVWGTIKKKGVLGSIHYFVYLDGTVDEGN